MLEKLVQLVAALETAIVLGRQGKADKSEEMFFDLSKGIVPSDYPGLFGHGGRTNIETARAFVRLAALRLVNTNVKGWEICSRCHGTGVKYGGLCYTCWGAGSVCRLTGLKQRGLGDKNKEVKEVVVAPVAKQERTKVAGISVDIMFELETANIMFAIWNNNQITKTFMHSYDSLVCIPKTLVALRNMLSQVETEFIIIVESCMEASIVASELKGSLAKKTHLDLMHSGDVVVATVRRHEKEIRDNGVRVEVVEPREDYVEEEYKEIWVDADNIFPK